MGGNLDVVGTLLRRTLGEDITLTIKVTSDIWSVEIDGAQLDSSLVNLANNARDAMPRGGSLTISARNIQIDAFEAKKHHDALSGEFVLIEALDTGIGMPPESVRQAFEPFFTTKEVGHGTGLGLSMVYGFVKQSKGWMDLQSDLGRGTVVRLYLPRYHEAEKEVGPKPKDRSIDLAIGTETILVVEDNPMMRQIVVKQLTALGYSLIEAENGDVALLVLGRPEQRIDLLFTDIVMAGSMDGYELAQSARKVRPEINVLLTSGYTGGASSVGPMVNTGFLAKANHMAELAKAVRTALDTVPENFTRS